MAQEEIKIVDNGKFLTITCTEGHRITDWVETDDIKDYHSFTIAYAPRDIDPSIYHCLTEEEHEKYQVLCDEAIKEDMEKEREHRPEEELEIEENN